MRLEFVVFFDELFSNADLFGAKREGVNSLNDVSAIFGSLVGHLDSACVPVNLSENAEEYELSAFLPLIDPKNVKVDVDFNRVTVSVDQGTADDTDTDADDSVAEKAENESTANTVVFKEFGVKDVVAERTVSLEKAVDVSKVEVSFENAVLTVKLPLDPDRQSRVFTL